MMSIGFYEARTHLSELLDQVAQGKKILVTRRGKPVALIVPPPQDPGEDIESVVTEMLAFRDREGPKLRGKTTIKKLIEEGRRF